MVRDHVVLGSEDGGVVIQKTEQGVQAAEHVQKFANLGDVDWHDLYVFQEVLGATSLRMAALKLGVSVNTVRAKINRLETALGETLFARSREGVRPTAEGIELFELAMEMQTATSRLQIGRGNNIVTSNGELRICSTEGVGELWLTPRISKLQESVPGYAIVLDSDCDQKRILRSSYDLRLSFQRPTEPGAVVSRLATLHFILYGSVAYFERYGTPKSLDDGSKHRFVVQNAPGLLQDALSLFVGQAASQQMNLMSVNTSYSLFRAISNGVGIGALPTYISAISDQVIPLDLPVRMKFDLWLSYDQILRKSKPVRAAINWLNDCFDTGKHPWFGERFLHPSEFSANQLNAQANSACQVSASSMRL